MGKRSFFASAMVTMAATFAALVACSGSDATIGGDTPDASSADDSALPGNDSASNVDTGGPADAGPVPDSAPPIDAGKKDGGGKKDAGVDAGEDAGPADAGYDGGPLNGCSAGNYNDRSNGGQGQRTITFPAGLPGSFAYSVPCMRIKAGQSVQFDGNFANHPLEARGGTVPTPFTLTNTGISQTFAFPTAGTYGFHCQIHATMIGAIEVVN